MGKALTDCLFSPWCAVLVACLATGAGGSSCSGCSIELRGGGGNGPSAANTAESTGQNMWKHVTPHSKREFADLAGDLETWLKKERGIRLRDANRDQILEAADGVKAVDRLQNQASALAGISPGEWCGNRTDLTIDELNERMWLACQLGDEDILQDAVNDGAEVNATDLCGWGAIHYAALCNQPSVIQTLIVNTSCDVNARTEEGLTALMIAAARGHTLLLDQADANQRQAGSGATALHWAAAAGSKSSCHALVEGHANLAMVDEQGRTAQDWASDNAYPDLAYTLNGMAHFNAEWQEHVRLVDKQAAGLNERERQIAMEVGWTDWSGVGLGAAPLQRVKGTTLLERSDPSKYHQGLPGKPPLDSILVTAERLDPCYEFKDGIITEVVDECAEDEFEG